MNKEKILIEIDKLIKEEGCYSEVMNVAGNAWINYKGSLDEQLGMFEYLVKDVVTPEKAREWIKNEKTPGYFNLSFFPRFRAAIEKIANET